MSTSRWDRFAGAFDIFSFGGDGGRRGPSQSPSEPEISPALLLFGGLAVVLVLYMVAAVTLVQGGAYAALSVGIIELAIGWYVQVSPSARVLPLLVFVSGGVLIGAGVIGIVF